MVKNTLAKPEIQQSIQQEKAELSKMYRETARRVVASISDTDIGKASLQQKAISSGVLLDKALLLAGEPTSNVDVRVLMELVDEIRDKRDRPPVLSLPANPA
jgi:ABC-type dipeptide/oligopeptide/nickel transport system ATPase subunit